MRRLHKWRAAHARGKYRSKDAWTQVFIGGSAQPWANVKFKSDSKWVVKGGGALKTLFPRDVAVGVKVVNSDGSWVEGTFVW